MHLLKRIIFILLAAVLLLVAWVGFVIYVKSKPSHQLSDSWVFKENRVGPITGDLGGIEISMPPHVARFVEYEGDPHFLEPRQGPTPTRTSQSKFRAFGFELRFPDKLLLSPETEKEKRLSNIFNTMWLSVGVDVKPCHDDSSLQRILNGAVATIWDDRHKPGDPPALWKDKHGYKRSPNTLYGLIVDEVYGYSEESRINYMNGVDGGDKNIYHHIDNQGRVDTYIECSNVRHDAAPCNQKFVLPTTKNTIIWVHYRIGLLPQWREIQGVVTQVILNFAIKPNENIRSIVNQP